MMISERSRRRRFEKLTRRRRDGGAPFELGAGAAVASAGSLRYRWSRGSSDQIEHWTARHCSRHEFGVELPQLVTAGAAPVLHGGIELADVLAAPADVDHQ